MSLFSEVEKTIERTFRKWTERAFGPAESDELLLVHRAILEEIEGKIQVVQRGRRLFPYNDLRVTVSLAGGRNAATCFKRRLAGHRLENDIRECLKARDVRSRRGSAVVVETAAEASQRL